MDSKSLNIVLVGVIIYLLMQRKKKKITSDQIKYAEAVGMAKTIGDLGTTF